MIAERIAKTPIRTDILVKLVNRLRTGLLVVGATGGTLWITPQEDFEWAARKAGLKSSKDTARSPEDTIVSDAARCFG